MNKLTVEKIATGLQWTTTEIKPKPTHTQNQSKEFFVTKTSKSIIGVWYIRCIDLTLMQLLQCTVIGLCKVELPRKYSYFLFKRVLKAQPFTSMHKRVSFSQNQDQLQV